MTLSDWSQEKSNPFLIMRYHLEKCELQVLSGNSIIIRVLNCIQLCPCPLLQPSYRVQRTSLRFQRPATTNRYCHKEAEYKFLRERIVNQVSLMTSFKNMSFQRIASTTSPSAGGYQRSRQDLQLDLTQNATHIKSTRSIQEVTSISINQPIL